MEEYLCSSWKKYKEVISWRAFPTLCHFLVWGMKKCLAVLVNNMSRQWLYDAVAAELSNKTPEPAKYVSVISTWCYAPWMSQLMFLMESLLYKANHASPLFITSVWRRSYGCNQFFSMKVCFFPFQIHQQKHELKCHFCLALDINFHKNRTNMYTLRRIIEMPRAPWFKIARNMPIQSHTT